MCVFNASHSHAVIMEHLPVPVTNRRFDRSSAITPRTGESWFFSHSFGCWGSSENAHLFVFICSSFGCLLVKHIPDGNEIFLFPFSRCHESCVWILPVDRCRAEWSICHCVWQGFLQRQLLLVSPRALLNWDLAMLANTICHWQAQHQWNHYVNGHTLFFAH